MQEKKIILVVLSVLVVFIIGCSKPADVQPEQLEQKEEIKTEPVQEVEEMKKALFIIAQQNFRDEELAIPQKILEDNGIKVDVASITTETAEGMFRTKVKPDLTVKDALNKSYDAIAVVGGSGSPVLADYPEVLDIVKKQSDEKKIISAICIGPYILAKADILRGKKATVFFSAQSKSAFDKAGAIYTGENVTIDGKLVTANGPEAAEEFGNALVKVIGE